MAIMMELENRVSGTRYITTIEIGLKVQALWALVENHGDENEINNLFEEIAAEDLGVVKVMMDHRINKPKLP